MSRKCEEIHIQVLYIRYRMRNALCTVHHKVSTLLMGNGSKGLYIIYSSEYIGHTCHGNYPGLLIDKRFKLLRKKTSVFFTFKILDGRSVSLCRKSPREHIAVMFNYRCYNLITLFKTHFSERICHKVQAFRSISCKDYLSVRSCIDEACHLYTGCFISFGRIYGKLI